ncbi:MAG: efflux RND transporter periplasmic adaptor subunit [Acidobacteriota bacterium]
MSPNSAGQWARLRRAGYGLIVLTALVLTGCGLARADDAPPAAGKGKILYYVDPMNPTQKSDKPGKAPCGMDLVPVYEEDGSTGGAPPGSVKLSPQKQQLIGVRSEEVSERPLSKTVRTVGRIAFDERLITHVHTKFPGWISKVYATFQGQQVTKDQPLAEIVSPEFISAQKEYLIARKSFERLKASSFEGVGDTAASFLESARDRLRLRKVSDEQIAGIEQRNTPLETLTLHSAVDGFITSIHAFEGQQVTPDMEIYTIADPSNVWVLADIYEYEVPMMKVDQPVTMSLPYIPGKLFTGKITYIYPKVDQQSRTLKVRAEFPNPKLELKPEMFANIAIKVDYGSQLAIPREAVLDSGTSQTVFVAREDGYFEPRTVKLGQQVSDYQVVLDGLKAGERVVTSAHFLIDSESQIKSALGGM